jgi:hypothetical protein
MRRINQVKTENAQVILADGSALSASTAGMTFRDIGGTLGASIRAVREARMDHIQQSKDNIVSPLPPSSPFMFDGLMPAGNSSMQISSMLETIATMLGYVLPSSVPPPLAARVEPATAGATQDHKHDSIGSLTDSSGGNAGQEAKPPVDSGTPTTAEMPLPMVVSSLRDGNNPAPMVVSSFKAQGVLSESQNSNQLLDESDDDDDFLMEPVLFTPKLPARTTTPTVVSSSSVAQALLLDDESDDDDSWMEPVLFTLTPKRTDTCS